MESYDTDKFLQEVQDLLGAAGKSPAPLAGEHRRQAHIAACMLLRSFRIEPSVDQVQTLVRSSDLPAWSERDE